MLHCSSAKRPRKPDERLDCEVEDLITACPRRFSPRSHRLYVRRVSEYQYYEFQALNRPLSREEQEQLRAISPRGPDHRNQLHQHWSSATSTPTCTSPSKPWP